MNSVSTSRRHGSYGSAGFTLIELLVVISILGILAGVVVFAVGGISDRGQASACAEDARTMKTAEETQFAKAGAYVDEAGLVSNGLLSAQSSMHDITLANSKYAIVDTGTCVGASSAPAAALPVASPAAWFDASDAASVALTGGGSQYVSSWNDKVSGGANLANSTASASITYSTTAINGHPAITTTGAAVLRNTTQYGPSVTVFAAARMTGGAKQRIVSAWNNNWLLGWWNGMENEAYFDGWLTAPWNAPASTTNTLIYAATSGNGQATVWRNGTQLATAAGGFTPPNGLVVGGAYSQTNEYSAANIGEVIVYNSILTPAQRQSVESYLATKWGVTLGS